MTGVVLVYIIVLAVAIVLHLYIVHVATEIAADKGYTERKWFHICFWFGILGFMLVAAMPDLRARELQAETNKLLTKIADSQSALTPAANKKQADDVASYLPEL